MDYSKMSDFEINSRVLALESGLVPLDYPFNDDYGTCAGVKDRDGNLHLYNYCNSPLASWPIIVANQIDIIQDNGQGCALATSSAVMMMQGEDVPSEQDVNPLRAAMIVYLMMQEGAVENKDTGKWHCDFCGKSQDEAELMIAAPNEIGICNRCVCECNEIILRQIRTQQAVKPLKQQGGE